MLFFTKKTYLIDLFEEGFTDIHNHLLPAIDDGSTSMEVTVAMIKKMRECNITIAVATPHIMDDYYNNTTVKIKEAFKNIQSSLPLKESKFITNAAAEYMLDAGFEELLDKEDFLFVKDKILLTELSYFQKPNSLNTLVFELRNKEIDPILAHPERYRYLNGLEAFQDLKDRGFSMQLNCLSLSGHYGKDALKKSQLLLENGLYNFIATDAHKVSHLNQLKELRIKNRTKIKLEAVIENHNAVFTEM